MSRLYKTEGVVLRHSYMGEADALLTFCTPERGKLRAVARGVRRPKSRLAGHLEPLTYCTMMLAEGRTLDVVSGCETLDSFQGIKSDLWLLSCGLYLADLADRLSAEGAENRPLFHLLLNALRSLAGGVDPSLVLRYFEFRSLACCGYLPELWECAACHRKLEATTNHFSPAAAGLLCPECRGREGLDRPASVDSVKVLRFFAQNECPALSRLRLKPRLAREIEDLMQGYVTYVLDREVASAKWLRQLRAEDNQSRKAPDGFIGSQPPVESGTD
ncbi:MAG TPA: DNA repair protein RecO [Dehalococcoidia bacterium]|nr:DNA repair protein RecO [Dehalococcoidia bacterium]